VRFDRGTSKDELSAFTTAFQSPDVRIYKFAGALPRLAVYTAVKTAQSDADALVQLAAPAFDPSKTAVITVADPAARNVAAKLASGGAPVRAGSIETYASQVVRGSVDTPAPALAVLNDSIYPGWTATVDGVPTAIVPANYMFRGVLVPAGRHVVEFRYAPESFRLGLVITAISLLLCAALLAADAYRRRRRAGEPVA
jgi:hypothetical protein